MDFIDIVLVVVGVGYLLVRRMAGDLVQVKRLLVLPLVLTAVGLSQVHDVRLDAATVAFLALGAVISLVIGTVRGLTVHLGVRDGELWMRYRAVTVGLWVLNLAVKASIVPAEVALTGHSVATATQGMLFTIGLGILAESAVVLLRALRRDGTVVWAKGKDGAPHRPSPTFDRLREQFGSGDHDLLHHVVSTTKRDW